MIAAHFNGLGSPAPFSDDHFYIDKSNPWLCQLCMDLAAIESIDGKDELADELSGNPKLMFDDEVGHVFRFPKAS